MAFRGLFVGIDRYLSSGINHLSCARRDAIALHALFTDNFGAGSTLLTDEQATRGVIEHHFQELAECDEEDVVVIAFSGHGSETHELVTYDTDPKNLADTAIPLSLLTEWFRAIPAKRLVCFLDCCFSGGMGAKVLKVDTVARGMTSSEEFLARLSGNGRLILTASQATEEAFENARIGHGLLTYYVLRALQGDEEVREAGKISVYRLLEYVSQRVAAEASILGRQQRPTLRGTIEEALTWPIFYPGATFKAAFPERQLVQVTEAVHSLEPYGFPTSLLEAWAREIPSLNQLQIDAINEFDLLAGQHLVVSAPTSSGKTMIGELAALKGCLDRKRAFFLLPLRALVNDKYEQFNRVYGDFGVRTIRATGERSDDIPALLRGQYDICLMTYEKFSNLVLAHPYLLAHVGTIVIDEVQMISDESRGVNLEFVLTLLRMRRRQGVEPQLIALSAVIGETNGLEGWLGARLLRRSERPVPLDEGIIRGDGSLRYLDPDGQEHVVSNYIAPTWTGKQSSQIWIIPLVKKLVDEGKQVIVFRGETGQARGCALYLARALDLPPAQTALDLLPTGDLSNASTDLRSALAQGVAFHTSHLNREERQIIEEQFREPNTSLRVIAATTTLAMGINTPAEAVIVVELMHPGNKPYSVAEYKNIIGRAGRLGFSEHGTSYLIAPNDYQTHTVWNSYVCGQPESLVSRFVSQDTDPRSLILRVIVSSQRITKRGIPAEDVISFLEGSFSAYQQMQQVQTWKWNREQLFAALNDLEQHKLIERDEGNSFVCTELGRLSGENGVEVQSIIRLVEIFSSLSPESINDPTLIAAAQVTAEMDDVYFPINKRSTQKEPFVWRHELQRQGVQQAALNYLNRTLTDKHQPTLRAKKAAACLLWMSDLPLSEVERILIQFGGASNSVSGPVRSVASRTRDLVLTVTQVAELIHPGLDLSDRTTRLLARLEVGVPSAIADLASVIGSRLTRAEYLTLLQAGKSTIDDIEASDDEDLIEYIGGSDKRGKLAQMRKAIRVHRELETDWLPAQPLIPDYEG